MFEKGIRGWVIAGTVIMASIWGFYFLAFGSRGLGGPETFGQFGDFVGGVANPFLGFLTILLLVRSIFVQQGALEATQAQLKLSDASVDLARKELELSREEMQLTRKEMIQGNQLYHQQVTLHQRQNQREQLEKYFERMLSQFDRLSSESFSVIANRGGFNIDGAPDLKSWVRKFERGKVNIDRFPHWDDPLYLGISGPFREIGHSINEAACALVAYTDNAMLAHVIREQCRKRYNDLLISGILSQAAVDGLLSAIDVAIVDRGGVSFPPFVGRAEP